MSAPTRHGRTLRAFSLAEMLIVIGIIAILIALLLPTVTRVRQQARTAQCASNLSQIYKAELLWKADNTRDAQGGGAYNATGWMSSLSSYLASADASSGQTTPLVYYCPEDTRPIANLGTIAGGGSFGTGGAGGATGGGGTGGGGNTNAILPQNLFIRWYSNSYGTYDVPLAVGPRAIAKNVTPTSYELWFEQEPASVNEMIDFNDLVVVLKDNGDGTTSITLSPMGDGSHHADAGSALVDKGQTPEHVIWDHCYRTNGTQPGAKISVGGSLPSVSSLGTSDPGGTTGSTGNSASTTVAHYGLNYAINDIMGHSDKVLGMDYLVDLIDVRKDDWIGTTWVDQSSGDLRFARHHNKQLNVLFGDGSVRLTQMIVDDPKWSPYKNYQKGTSIHEAGPYLMDPSWTPEY